MSRQDCNYTRSILSWSPHKLHSSIPAHKTWWYYLENILGHTLTHMSFRVYTCILKDYFGIIKHKWKYDYQHIARAHWDKLKRTFELYDQHNKDSCRNLSKCYLECSNIETMSNSKHKFYSSNLYEELSLHYLCNLQSIISWLNQHTGQLGIYLHKLLSLCKQKYHCIVQHMFLYSSKHTDQWGKPMAGHKIQWHSFHNIHLDNM